MQCLAVGDNNDDGLPVQAKQYVTVAAAAKMHILQNPDTCPPQLLVLSGPRLGQASEQEGAPQEAMVNTVNAATMVSMTAGETAWRRELTLCVSTAESAGFFVPNFCTFNRVSLLHDLVTAPAPFHMSMPTACGAAFGCLWWPPLQHH